MYEDIPADLREPAQEYRSQMIETVVELDDQAIESYLEGVAPDEETITTKKMTFMDGFFLDGFKNRLENKIYRRFF